MAKDGTSINKDNLINIMFRSPGRVPQLVRESSRHAKVAGSIPGRGMYQNQPMNA